MNRRGIVFGVLALVVTLAVPAKGSDSTEEVIEARKCKAIPNLLIAIQSDNDGLRESAAYFLGEFKCDQAVLPLMEILHDSDRESGRLVAALALCRIGDARGVYAVKRAVLFDGSSSVRSRCAWFYNQYVEEGTFVFLPGEGEGRYIALK